MDDTLSRGWRTVRLWLSYVVALFGGPAALAALGWIGRGPRAKLLVFLRTAEALARRLLHAEAATMAVENAPPSRGVGRASSGYGRGGFAHPDPARWGVSFRMLTQARPKPRPARVKNTTAPHTTVAATLPLAERIEALLRVMADPSRHARRLAARLRRGDACAPAVRPEDVRPLDVWREIEVWERLAPRGRADSS